MGDIFKSAICMTLRDLFNAYMANHARLHCKCWREFERMFELYLWQWADAPADSIRKYDVKQLQTRLADKPATANKVIQLLSAVYNRGIEWELVTVNPAARLKKYKVRARERFLKDTELERFFEAVGALKHQDMQDFILMCLVTGARRRNVASMRWEHLDIKRAIWFIPETKNGTSHWLPLTTFALAILERRKASARNEWVFPSDHSFAGYITKPERAWRNVLRMAGLENIRIHDLRRTLASYQAMTGANLSVIKDTLNHKDFKSVQIYARLQLDPIRLAMEKATGEMFRLKDSG